MANEKAVATTLEKKEKRKTEERKTGELDVILTLSFMNPQHQPRVDGNMHCNYTLLAFY